MGVANTDPAISASRTADSSSSRGSILSSPEGVPAEVAASTKTSRAREHQRSSERARVGKRRQRFGSADCACGAVLVVRIRATRPSPPLRGLRHSASSRLSSFRSCVALVRSTRRANILSARTFPRVISECPSSVAGVRWIFLADI